MVAFELDSKEISQLKADMLSIVHEVAGQRPVTWDGDTLRAVGMIASTLLHENREGRGRPEGGPGSDAERFAERALAYMGEDLPGTIERYSCREPSGPAAAR